MKQLRTGYTTGACAAAGVRAALACYRGEKPDIVSLRALDGTMLRIPVVSVVRCPGGGVCAEVVKDAGDDPDITNGVSVFTTVELRPEPGIVFRAGEGIGTVTKPGLAVPPGEPAINPGPRKLIQRVVDEDLGGISAGVIITIAIPAGVELAKKTLNPILGIEGGISIIGTTGVVRPMSEEGFKNSLLPQIDVARAAGCETLIFVPGKIGERIGCSWGLPREAMVQTSNFIGFMLEGAADRGVRQVLLFGHPGKLAKVAAGVFHTHNRIADARLATFAAYGAAAGLAQEQVQRVLAANTTEDAIAILSEAGLRDTVCRTIAGRASARAEQYLFGRMKVGAVLVSLRGELLGMDEKAEEIGRSFSWRIPANGERAD